MSPIDSPPPVPAPHLAPVGAATPTRRLAAAAALVLAIVVLVLTRLRGESTTYVQLLRRLDAAGVPEALWRLDTGLLFALGSVLAARLAHGRGRIADGLGLARSVAKGAVFALLAGAPMLLHAMLSGSFRVDAGMLRGIVVAPLVEELLFRAVLVGVAVRVLRWPFWPVAIVAGLVFGSMHVPWDGRFGAQHIGPLLATSAGGIWYAWIVRAHDWNLWTTVLLHAVMNGAWMLFGVAEDAAGGASANVGRGLTILVGTVLTVRRLRRTRP